MPRVLMHAEDLHAEEGPSHTKPDKRYSAQAGAVAAPRESFP